MRVALLGLDNAGKTTLLGLLSNNHIQVHNPTSLMTRENVIIGNLTINVTDLGGHSQVQKNWATVYGYIDAIVYVLDLSEPESDRRIVIYPV